MNTLQLRVLCLINVAGQMCFSTAPSENRDYSVPLNATDASSHGNSDYFLTTIGTRDFKTQEANVTDPIAPSTASNYESEDSHFVSSEVLHIRTQDGNNTSRVIKPRPPGGSAIPNVTQSRDGQQIRRKSPFSGTEKQREILDNIECFMDYYYNPVAVIVGLMGKIHTNVSFILLENIHRSTYLF